MSYCGSCGTDIGSDVFCSQCGQPAARVAEPTRAAPDPPGSSAEWSYIPASSWLGPLLLRWRNVPVEMQVVCGLMAAAGVLAVGLTVWGLSATWQVLTGGGPFWVFGLLLLSGLIAIGAIGVALLVLAWRMGVGDRVARGLSYAVLGAVLVALLIGDDHRLAVVLVMLACAVSLGLLAFSPNVKAFFDGAPTAQEAVSVVTARVLIAAWAGLILLNGLVLLPLGQFDGKLALIGLVLIALGVGAFVLNGKLAEGDRRARVLVTGAAAANVVLQMTANQWQTSSVLPVALSVAVVAFLWAPTDAKQHFGDPIAPAYGSPDLNEQ